MKLILEESEIRQIITEHVANTFPAAPLQDLNINIVNGRGPAGTTVEIEIPPTGTVKTVVEPAKEKVKASKEPAKQVEEDVKEPVKEEAPLPEKQDIESAAKDLASVFQKKS